MKWLLCSIAGFFVLPGFANANIFQQLRQSSIEMEIDSTTQFLLKRWNNNDGLKENNPPQVLPIAAGAKVYGACGEQVVGDEVAGSAYCPLTNTIYLVPEQLSYFWNEFGPSAVAYVIAHEFGHATQRTFEFFTTGPSQELQADCLAGVFIKEGSQELGITPNDVIAMSRAAHSIGSESHGSGPQRAYALLSGMGYVKASCTNKQMQALADGEIDVPALNKLNQTRSGTGGINTTNRPLYPKSIKGSLGI